MLPQIYALFLNSVKNGVCYQDSWLEVKPDPFIVAKSAFFRVPFRKLTVLDGKMVSRTASAAVSRRSESEEEDIPAWMDDTAVFIDRHNETPHKLVYLEL